MSICLHERSNVPYFGIEQEETVETNPCGTHLEIYVLGPERLN